MVHPAIPSLCQITSIYTYIIRARRKHSPAETTTTNENRASTPNARRATTWHMRYPTTAAVVPATAARRPPKDDRATCTTKTRDRDGDTQPRAKSKTNLLNWPGVHPLTPHQEDHRLDKCLWYDYPIDCEKLPDAPQAPGTARLRARASHNRDSSNIQITTRPRTRFKSNPLNWPGGGGGTPTPPYQRPIALRTVLGDGSVAPSGDHVRRTPRCSKTSGTTHLRA